jgi:hypothetical protein
MKNWEPADCMTQDFFNPHGLKNYDAILMLRTDTDEGYAPYDLTILDGSPSSVHGAHYLAAHGSVVQPIVFKSINDAKLQIIDWYMTNRQLMAIRGAA